MSNQPNVASSNQQSKAQSDSPNKINTEKLPSFSNYKTNQIPDRKNDIPKSNSENTLIFDEERFSKITENIQKKFPIHQDPILPMFLDSLVFAEIGKQDSIIQGIYKDMEQLCFISEQFNDKSNECSVTTKKLYESVKVLDKSISKTSNLIRKMSKKKYSFLEFILMAITWVVYLIPNAIKALIERLKRKNEKFRFIKLTFNNTKPTFIVKGHAISIVTANLRYYFFKQHSLFTSHVA